MFDFSRDVKMRQLLGKLTSFSNMLMIEKCKLLVYMFYTSLQMFTNILCLGMLYYCIVFSVRRRKGI